MTLYQKYPAYKKSGEEWLGEIPKGWETDRTRNHFSFRKGLTITKENLQVEGIPTINYGEIHSKFGFRVDPAKHSLKCVSIDYRSSDPKALLKKHDFIFADTSEDLDGSGNFSRYDSDEEAFAGYHTVIARLNSGPLAEFLAYLFDSKSFRDQVRRNMKGVKVYSITQGMLKALGLVLPPPAEQTAIAAFLDDKTAKIDKAIAQKEQLIALLKERKQIIIQNAVTKGLDPKAKMKDSGIEWIGEIPEHWEKVSVRHILINLEQGESPTASNNYDKTYVLKLSAVKAGSFFASETKPISSGSYQSRFQVTQDNFLLTRGNTPELVGDSCIVEQPVTTKVMFSDLIYRLSFRFKSIDLYFILLAFQSAYLRRQISSTAVGSSSSMVKVAQGDIKSWFIFLPSKTEQLNIGSRVKSDSAKIGIAISQALCSIETLREYRTTLIDSAVTGKIKVPGI